MLFPIRDLPKTKCLWKMWLVLSLNSQCIHLWKCKTAIPQNRGFSKIKKDKLGKKVNKPPCFNLNCPILFT